MTSSGKRCRKMKVQESHLCYSHKHMARHTSTTFEESSCTSPPISNMKTRVELTNKYHIFKKKNKELRALVRAYKFILFMVVITHVALFIRSEFKEATPANIYSMDPISNLLSKNISMIRSTFRVHSTHDEHNILTNGRFSASFG